MNTDLMMYWVNQRKCFGKKEKFKTMSQCDPEECQIYDMCKNEVGLFGRKG
jgi:hypothetical protein